MIDPIPKQTSPERQLEDLLRDPRFLKTLDLITKEVMRFGNLARDTARGFVLSAIGEPVALAQIHGAWFRAAQAGENAGLAKVIMRRRVIDLLRKDARPAHQCSLPATAEPTDTDPALAFNDLVRSSPRAQLEFQQIIQMIRAALVCFATQGQTQWRQAHLLRRYALDETQYAELSTELACSETALRVRVHKAMLAFRRHIRDCHVDLEHLLERDHRKTIELHAT